LRDTRNRFKHQRAGAGRPQHTTGRPTFIIEDVAYQKALPQQLKDEGIWNVMTTRPGNQDKRSRLVLTANLIKTGKILFPREGAEQLIQQIVHFGVEKHDDLADAFAYLVVKSIENNKGRAIIVQKMDLL
jgi:predicted phage terminase large subunit-like protein